MEKESDVIVILYGGKKAFGKLSKESSQERGWFVLTDDKGYDGGWNIDRFDKSYGYKYAWHTGCYDDVYDYMNPDIKKKKSKKNKLYKL